MRTGKRVEDIGLFGPAMAVVGAGNSNVGRLRLPMRLMISLLYLRHTFNESDEGVCERWSDSPTWQYFSGQGYFENRTIFDPSAIGLFQGLLGEEGVQELLVQTSVVTINIGLIEAAMRAVIVDSTVQSKAVAREKIAEAASEAHGIALKRGYAQEGQDLARKAGCYAHSKQYRFYKMIKRQRTILGRLARDSSAARRCWRRAFRLGSTAAQGAEDPAWRLSRG